MQSKECKTIKTVVLRLDTGDDLLLSIKKCAEEHNIRSGYFTAIGGLKEACYGLYEDKKYRIIKKTADHCFEVMGTSGNISIKEGEILVHCHLNFGGEKEGEAFGGHLMEGTIIRPFAEIFINEVDIEIGRRLDTSINLWPMVI